MNNDLPSEVCTSRTRRLLSAVVFGLFALTLLLLLFGAYCTFSHKKWAMADYGVYVNMLWNTGHGDWFRCLVDRSYLGNHLSFSLAVVGLLFHVWDSPLLLMVVQWVSFCIGCSFVARACMKYSLPTLTTAAVLFFYAAWPFAQSVLLSSFHGVTMYLLLMPWLYYACAFSRRWVPLPLVLLLGLREDAFFYALPVLLYFAVRDRWLLGYLYCGVAVLYGLLAIVVLYPWINGLTLLERRSAEIGSGAVESLFSVEGLRLRAGAMLWIFLPFLLLIRRGIGRAVLLALVPVVFTMASGFARQYQMRNHYPAIVMAGMVIGMVEALGCSQNRSGTGGWRRQDVFAGLLVMLTLMAHLAGGFLYYGKYYHSRVGWPHGTGRLILKAVKHIPKEGILLVPFELGGACANRADIIAWRHYKPDRHDIDLVFCRLDHLVGTKGKKYRQLISKYGFGVRYYENGYIVMEKDGSPLRNREVLNAAERYARTLHLARTLRHAGKNLTDDGQGVRYWNPAKKKPPATVVFGKSMTLGPGTYRAVLKFRSEPPEKGESWGTFELFTGAEEPMASVPIEASDRREYRLQSLPFSLAGETRVEPRITGGGAPLWLSEIEFLPVLAGNGEGELDTADPGVR